MIRLPNDLEVLLVHDEETDKASAAMDVNVGNFSDPEELPGLAHCVEHMLFMGTKKVRAYVSSFFCIFKAIQMRTIWANSLQSTSAAS